MAQVAKENTGLRLAARYTVLVLVALVFAFPLVFMLVSSLKPDLQLLQDTGSLRAFLPVGDISLDNYVAAFDRALYQVPIVRSVYPYAKQLVEFFYSDQEIEFQSAVAVPYPSDHLYTLGFVTSSGMATLHRELGGAYVSVFIPSSPMPMTGWTVFVSADRLISLPISVDEALRVTVSAGVLIPPTERVAELERSLQHLLDPQGRATGAEPTSRERPDNPERDEDAG